MEDTIAAISTPFGEGGIGIVRMSGSLTEKILDEVFVAKNQQRWKDRQSHRLYLGHLQN
ncbi:MAG: tRNA uridine-5-carboxymethylaminomethyl(34) synthesis GTPase MnmE, partial [Clostridia bacterium]|nr:tRNA uridine-5-carboxymethylaminomethyl(34) synthesis GTPase MnmE [Clostridia bacterium]